jgi:hypothetical protein
VHSILLDEGAGLIPNMIPITSVIVEVDLKSIGVMTISIVR